MENGKFNTYSLFTNYANKTIIGGKNCGTNPNNILKYKNGEKYYYLTDVHYLDGSNEVIINIKGIHNNKKYHNTIRKTFTDTFTFVPFTSLPKTDKELLIRKNKYEYQQSVFNEHNIKYQNSIINDLILAMKESKKSKETSSYVCDSFVNRDYVMDKYINDMSYVNENISSLSGIPEKYFDTKSNTVKGEVDDTIIIKQFKKTKPKTIIVEPEPILGLPKNMREYSKPLDGISIGSSNSTNNNISIGMSSGSTEAYSTGIGMVWGDSADMKFKQKLIPHNGIKFNDKISIDEEKCVILKRKNKL